VRRGVTAPHSEHWITWRPYHLKPGPLQRRRVDFLRIAYPLVVEDAMPACFYPDVGGRYDLRVVIHPMFEAEQIAGSDFEPTMKDFFRPPFRRFQFSTPMSTEHAARVLQDNVEPPRQFGWPTSSKRGFFEGRVAGSRFKIHRVINAPNSFLPIVEGRFRRDGLATIVTLTMRMVWPVIAVWLAIVMFLFWNSLVVDSRVAATFGARMAVLGMTAFLYLVASVCFAIEVRLAMKRLLSLLCSGPARSGVPF